MNERIKLVIVNIDGVLTDGKLNIDTYGNVSKSYNRRDFYSLSLLRSSGILTATINMVPDTCDDYLMQWKVVDANLHGPKKREAIERYMLKSRIKWEEVAYIGCFEDDAECICMASWSGCPADAIPEVKRITQFVSQLNGGQGVAFDLLDAIVPLMDKR